MPDAIVGKLFDKLTMSGDHADTDLHVETLRRYRDIGLGEVAFMLHEDHEAAIRAIGTRILPAFDSP